MIESHHSVLILSVLCAALTVVWEVCACRYTWAFIKYESLNLHSPFFEQGVWEFQDKSGKVQKQKKYPNSWKWLRLQYWKLTDYLHSSQPKSSTRVVVGSLPAERPSVFTPTWQTYLDKWSKKTATTSEERWDLWHWDVNSWVTYLSWNAPETWGYRRRNFNRILSMEKPAPPVDCSAGALNVFSQGHRLRSWSWVIKGCSDARDAGRYPGEPGNCAETDY